MFFGIVPCHANVDDRASDVHCARDNVQSPKWKAIYVVKGVFFISSRNVKEEVPETNQDHEEEHNKSD